MAHSIPIGARGADFSFARPPAEVLKRNGYSFAVGYVSVPPSSPAKNLTRVEFEALGAAGITTFLVFELSATRPDGGAAKGAIDGASARLLGDALGYPKDRPMLIACDTNTVPTNIAAHKAYMYAFAQAYYGPVGIYGDLDILEATAGLWVIGWVPNAWAWSASSRKAMEARARAAGAHVLQRTGFYIDGKYAIDPNDVIKEIRWATALEQEAELERPPVGGADVMVIPTNSEPRVSPADGQTYEPGKFVFVAALDGTLRHVVGYEGRLYDGLPRVAFTNAELDDWLARKGPAPAPVKVEVPVLAGTITLRAAA